MKLSLRQILKQIIYEKVECRNDEMKLYYEYTRYLGVPILKFPRLFYDNEFRKSMKVITFSSIARELRNMKSKGVI